jgi:hypothetical protein
LQPRKRDSARESGLRRHTAIISFTISADT